MQRSVLYLAGSVFLLVSAAHVMRLLLNVEVLIEGWIFPLWMSAVGAIITVLLGWLCLRAARKQTPGSKHSG